MHDQDQLGTFIDQLTTELGRAIDKPVDYRIKLNVEDHDVSALENRINELLASWRKTNGNATSPDISEEQQKQIEEHRQVKEAHKKMSWIFEYIAEHAPVMLFVKNADDLSLELWNKRTEELTGIARQDILGKTGYETFPKEEMDGFLQRDREVLTGRKLIAVEEVLTTKYGPRWIYTKKIPLIDVDGEPKYLLGISEDITERKRNSEELLRAKEAAEAANRAKSDFFANVSHELRTPLTLILGPLESLLSGEAGPVPDIVRERLMRMRRNAARLASMVNDLLDFVKLEAGKTQVQWQPVNVAEITSHLVEDAQLAAKARGVGLQLQIEQDPGHIPLDRRMYEKIVLNLLANALKFTPSGGNVKVTLRFVDNDVELLVADTGVGIPANKLPVIFDRFQQVDNSATRKYEGTGLGLALVKEFTELMKGQVSVESEIGKGSRFLVRLPKSSDYIQVVAQELLNEDLPNRFEHLLPPQDAGPEPVPRIGKPRLILAEDNSDMRAYVVQLLQRDYDIVAVDNGVKALESARAYLPDVIISDVMMPEMNGFELVRQIKQDPRLAQVPVLLLTARAGQEAIATGLDEGADDYLSKPFSPAELRARISAARRLHKASQDLTLKIDELVTTRDQLVEAEKLAMAGKVARAVAREVMSPLAEVHQGLSSLSANDTRVLAQVLPKAMAALGQCMELVSGLQRLSEPPTMTAPEHVELAPLLQMLTQQLSSSSSAASSPFDLEAESAITTVASYADLQMALKYVLSFLSRHRSDDSPTKIAIRVDGSGQCPQVTIVDSEFDMALHDIHQIFEPAIEFNKDASASLSLNTDLAIASQLFQRNGARINAVAHPPGGIKFSLTFE